MKKLKISETTKQWLMESEIPYVRFNAGEFFAPGTMDPKILYSDPFIQDQMKIRGLPPRVCTGCTPGGISPIRNSLLKRLPLLYTGY